MGDKQAVSEFLTYWEQLGLQKGLEQGMKGGLKQCLQEGLQQMRHMIWRQIQQRFGNIPPGDLKSLNQLPHEKHEQLGVAIITAMDYAELRQQLLPENGQASST